MGLKPTRGGRVLQDAVREAVGEGAEVEVGVGRERERERERGRG
jgi:hypothetical protein